MPIRKENRKFYEGEAWDETRRRILKRAGNKCEFCRKPNNTLVYVMRDGTGRWNQALAEVFRATRRRVKRMLDDLSMSTQKQRTRFQHLWRWFGPNGTELELTFPPGEHRGDQTPESGYIFLIKVILTIAHLNHTPGDDRDDNLMALCQRCHLNYDKEYHRMRRAERKDKERPILIEIERQHQGL